MNLKAHATKTMFNALAKNTFLRAKQWFQEHPDEPYCYWAKDDFISIADKNNEELLSKYPEIDDINDHTIVQWDSLSDTVFLSRFCPKLKQSICELCNSGTTQGDVDGGYHWGIVPDGENFKVLCYEKQKNM